MESGTVVLPRSAASPFRSAARRLLVAAAVLLVIATVVWLDGDGYSDTDGRLSWLDGLYYATVTASTTGYGDIAPLTQQARLVNVLVVTPLRILFVVALIGSAFEVVTAATRQLLRQKRYRAALQGHTVMVGFGTRGRAAVRALRERGVPAASIVAIDRDEEAVAEAVSLGLAAVHGDATRDGVQKAARVKRAEQIVVAVSLDATSVLATLTSHRLAPQARIIASVEAQANAPLLHDSGASSVVVHAETAGRLLGVAATHPSTARVFDELLAPDRPFSLLERPVEEHEVGCGPREVAGAVLAVVRGDQHLPYHSGEVGVLQEGDRVVVIEGRST